MRSPASKLRIAVCGAGAAEGRWSAAIAASTGLTLAAGRRPDALVVGPEAPEPYSQARDALEGGSEVLLAAPGLAADELRSLAALAAAQGRVLRFWEPFRAQRGFGFLRRLLGGEEPFWKPLYLRTLRLAPPAGEHPLDALATEELAMLDALLDHSPLTVDASLGCAEGAQGAVAAFVTLSYHGGLAVHATISVAEARPTRQLVVVTDGRSIVLDDGDLPLGQSVSAEYAGQPAWRPPSRSTAAQDPYTGELATFAELVAAHAAGEDPSVARRLRAAEVWQAVRRSMHAGQPVSLTADAAPELTLIRGNKKAASKSRKRPALTIVPAGPLAG
jgi:predicted dehydrogenase